MPRARSPNRDKAKQLWIESGKTRQLKQIAAELSVSEEQIRKWKNQDDWEQKGKVTLPIEKGSMKSNVTKRSRGAPMGNKNASGSHPGAPLGNRNSVKLALYAKTLTEEEKAFFDSRGDIDEEARLLNEAHLCEIREANIMNELNKCRNSPSGLAISTVTKEGEHTMKAGDKKTTFSEKTASNVKNTLEYIIHLEGQLTTVQRAYLRCIQDLGKVRERIRRQKEANAGNDSQLDLGDFSEDDLRRLAAIEVDKDG